MLYTFRPGSVCIYNAVSFSTGDLNNPFVPYTKLKRFEYAAED